MSGRKIVYATGKKSRETEDVPVVRVPTPPKVNSLWCSDIHLSHKPPIARSAEPCWYSAMQRQLDELRSVALELDVPIFVAGDIFDRWNPPPELINFAIR